MIKMVVFDMAGTTIDEDNLVYKTVQRALQAFDCPAELPVVLSHAAGKEKREAIRDTYEVVRGEAPRPELLDEMYAFFREQLALAYDELEFSLFEGVSEILDVLKGKGIVRIFNTGYSSEVAEKILQKVGVEVGKDIDGLITADHVTNSRPAPDMITLAMRRWNCRAAEVIKIGDSKVDIEEGKNAAVAMTIGITTGAQGREELAEAHPNAIIDRMEQLLEFV